MQNIKSKPLVTVTISAYNHERFVEKTILSIVNQTYGFENIELLVIDDCSQDNTGKILYDLSQKYSFTFIQNAVNRGAVPNKNTLLQMAKGKYVSGCGSDDYWHPEKIEKQVALMETLSDDYAICHTKAYIIDPDENFLFYQDRGIEFQETIMPKILIDNGIVAPSALFRRKIYDEIGLHDPNLVFEDRDMWIRIGLNYKVKYIDEPLVYRRHHPNNLSRNMKSNYEVYTGIFQKYRSYFEQYNLVDKYHYILFTHMSGSSVKLSFKHLMKIRNIKIIFQMATLRAFFKYLIPKSLLFSNFGLKIKRKIKSW